MKSGRPEKSDFPSQGNRLDRVAQDVSRTVATAVA